jgi:hypothetical protein
MGSYLVEILGAEKARSPIVIPGWVITDRPVER